MSHTRKAMREHVEAIAAELQRYGVTEYTTHPTTQSHVIVRFTCPDGRLEAITLGHGGDWCAQRNSRRDLRRLLHNTAVTP
jgi:hypothetical protein